ncbi:hypothetical protein OAI04_02735 [Hyphomicrobiales bacterium]|nr:hypothetical protein [Hyphomicrobiales bacterium]MDC3272421.1 hypothetical protein [Hyphomicrobiales bacterium]
MKTVISASLYERCLKHFANVSRHKFVVASSLPIPYFGDVDAYFGSNLRVVTAALNPSDIEFSNNVSRFDVETGLSGAKGLEIALKNYFKINPYKSWFRSFEPVLNGMGATYGSKMISDKTNNNNNNKKISTSLHLDMCSPVATTPTWSHLSDSEKNKLVPDGRAIFEELIVELKPHIVISSVGWAHIQHWNSKFSSGRDWPLICEYTTSKTGAPLKNSLKVQYKSITIRNSREFLFINATAANTPFGRFSTERKNEVGSKILEYFSLL